MRKWFERRKGNGGEDGEKEDTIDESGGRSVSDPKYPKEKGSSLGVFRRKSKSFTLTSGNSLITEVEHDRKVKELVDKADEVTLLSMKLDREIKRILYIVKEEENSQQIMWMRKTVPLLFVLMGRGKDEECSGLEELLVLLSHPSAEPEQVQTDCFCGSFNSTAGKNNGDDGSAEAVGEISRRPSSHDWIDKLVVSETGLCDHLISLSSHPDFTQRCVEANLPSNLFHCIRIVAVVEYEVAKPWGENDLIDMNPEILQLLSKLTKNITSRLATLLVTLCSSDDELVLEDIKHHIRRLLSIAVSSCPKNAIHLQIAASEVVCALASRISSPLIWYIHSNQIVFDMVHNLRMLMGDTTPSNSKDQLQLPRKSKAGKGMLHSFHHSQSWETETLASSVKTKKHQYAKEVPIEFGPAKRSSSFRLTKSRVNSQAMELISPCSSPASVNYVQGTIAEASGMWLAATKAVVAVIRPRSSHSKQLFMDFENAGGCKVLLSLLKSSVGERLSQMLDQLIVLSTSRDRGTLVTNYSVFQIVSEMLISCTPILSSVSGDDGLVNTVKLLADDTLLIVAQLAIGESRRRMMLSDEEREELLNGDEVRMRIVQAILSIYSVNPQNYVVLECRYHLLSSCIACLPFFESVHLKAMVVKVLEVVCVMFRNVEPTEALKCTLTTFATCVGEILDLIATWRDQYILPLEKEESATEAPKASSKGDNEVSSPTTAIGKGLMDVNVVLTDAKILNADAELLCELLEKILQFDVKKYESIFADAGLIDAIMLPLLARARELIASLFSASEMFSNTLRSSTLKAADCSLDILTLLCNALCSMISASPHLGCVARDQGICEELHKIIEKNGLQAAKAALKVLEQVVLCDRSGLKDELDFMLKLIQKAEYEGQYKRQVVVLLCIGGLLAEGNFEVKDAWREVSGFEVIVGLFLGFDRAFPIEATDSTTKIVPPNTAESGSGSIGTLESTSFLDDVFSVIEASFSTLICAMSAPPDVFDKRSGYRKNREHMAKCIQYGLLASRLYNSGAPLHPRFAVRTVNLVFQMVTEQYLDYITITTLKPENDDKAEEGNYGIVTAAQPDVFENSTVRNADAVNVLLHLLPTMPRSLAIPAIDSLLTIVHAGGVAELRELGTAGVIRSAASLVTIARLPVFPSKTTVSVDEKEICGSETVAAATAMPPSSFLLRDNTINGMVDSYSRAIWERSKILGISPQLGPSVDIVPHLLDLVITISAHVITGPDLRIVIQAVVFPLLISKYGESLRLGRLLGLTGMSCGLTDSRIAAENHLVLGNNEDFESTKKKWDQLDILISIATGPSGITGDGCAGSVPYLRLGGPNNTLNLNSIGGPISSSLPKNGKSSMSDASHMQLMEKLFFSCAREEVHMVHVVDLQGSKYSSQGTIAGTSTERGTRYPWPGQAGYGASFWVRINLSTSSKSSRLLERLKSWRETGSCRGNIQYVERFSYANSDSTFGEDNSSHFDVCDSADENETGTTPSSTQDTNKRKIYNGDNLVWIVSFSSVNGKAYLSLYMDTVEHVLCVQSSSAPDGTEFRSKPLTTLKMSGCDAWHHIAFSHVKKSMMGRKMQCTTDAFHLWVDGEEVALFNIDIPSYSSQGVPPTATFGIPVPQLFCDPSIKLSTIPLWHLGPTIVTCQPLPISTVSAMFIAGPSYSGVFSGENLRSGCSAITTTTILRRLLNYGVLSEMCSSQDGVNQALSNRSLQDFAKLLTYTDRNVLREKWDRSFMKEVLYDVIKLDSVAIWLSAQYSKPVSPTASTAAFKSGLSSIFPAPSLITNRIDVLHCSGTAAVYGGYGAQAIALPQPLPIALESIGGPVALYPLLFMAQTDDSIAKTLRLLSAVIRGSDASTNIMHSNLGYVFIAHILREKRHCLGPSTMDACLMLATDCVAETAVDIVQPKDWDRELSIMDREKTAYVAKGNSMGFGIQGKELSRGELILITEVCALKHLLLNHQVWGERNSPLLLAVLTRLNRLVSPSNCHAFCSFNAQMLHRTGLVRWILHILIEQRDELDLGTEATQDELTTTVMSSSAGVAAGGSFAHFSPVAGIAACGLEHRDEFTVLCTLLLQRVLVINVIPRDFDRIVGATTSLKMNTRFSQFRPPGSEPASLEQEKIMQKIGILPEEGSLGTVALARGDVVKMYLLRMLFETLSVSGGLVKEGEVVCGPQPCSAVADLLECTDEPVHCTYEGKQKYIIQMCTKSLKPEWFLCLLDIVTDEAGLTAILQLLCFLMQQVPKFAIEFNEMNGFELLETVIRRFHSSLPVLLPVVALLMHLPISGIPLYASANTMGPKVLEELFDSTPGPRISDLSAVNCMLRVLLPSLDVNLTILRAETRGGDTVRAKTVALFLLNLFYNTWTRLSKFHLLMFEPGLVGAISKCAKTAWTKPNTNIENVPCGEEILKLIKAILYESIKIGSPSGSVVFNVVMQILTGGGGYYREQRSEDSFFFSISKGTADALDEFHCHVVDSLVGYCRSMKVEIKGEVQMVDEMSTTQHQEQQHSSLICTSLDDASLLLDNFIGATSATVAALLFTDNDCSVRLYKSVMDLCLSIMNSPLWSYLTPLDDGDFRTSVIVMMLRTATVSMLKRATIGVIGSGNDNSSSRKRDDDEDSNSSLKCGDDKFSMQEEFEEELPPSSRAVLLTDVHSLVPLFRVISSNLDVLLPLDLPLDDEQEEEDYLKPSKVRTKSTSSLPSSSISDDSRSRYNQQSSNSLHVDSDSSPCSLLRQRAITFMRPISKHHSIGATSKLLEGISLARKGTEKNHRSFAVLRRTGSKDICTSGAFQWNRESTKTGLSNEPFFQFALKICKDGTLVEKLIAYELVGELLSLLVAVNDINGNGGVAKEQQNLVRDGGSFSRVKEEILDLITQILSMQNMRMQVLFEEYKLNISEAAKVMEELDDRVRSTLFSSLYLSDDDSICERDMNLDNDERQETDGGDSSRSTSPEMKLSCSSLKDSSDTVDALKEWLSIEAEELLQVFRSISNEIEPQLLPQLGMTVSKALLSFDQCSFSRKSDVGLARSSGAAIASAKRAEIVSRTYLRVGASHKRWLYAGLDGMIASKSQWCQWLGRFQGGFSLWEGGIFSLVVGGELASPLHFAPTSRNKTCVVSPQGMFDMDLLCSKKWRLDLREAFTPSRTRFRLIQNRSFFTDYDVQQYDDTLVEFKAAAVAAAINQPQPALESTEDPTSSEVVAHDNNDGGVSDTTDLENFLQKVESCSKPAEESSNIFDDDSPLDEFLEFEEDDGDECSSIDDGEEEESFGTEGISGLVVNTASSITEEEVSGEAICDRGASISSDKGITLEFEKPTLVASPIEKGLPKCSEFDEEDVSEVIGTALPTPAAALSSTPGIGETSKEVSFGFKEDNTTSGFETEVFCGFLDPVDWPAEACFNASRILGLEVRPCVAIICKHALYVVTGYSYKKPTEHEMKVGSSRRHSKFVLFGLRRVEQKTRGAPGGMIHGEQRSRFKVTLRRPSTVHYDKNNGMAFTGAETKKREYCSSRLDDSVHNSETDGEQQPPFSDVVVYRSTWGKIHAVYKRRYELREVGTEVFDVEGLSVFIIFDSHNLQEQFLTSLLMKPLKNSVFYSGKRRLWLPRGSTPVHARVAYKRSMKALRQEYTKNWLGGGMTNFDYLMALNVLAGRSFNDITQYPVFPWVIADYESEELDLTDVRSFRDLSKPMGAIGDERAAQFMERYEQFTHGISGEKHHPPPFFYGTHYSCAGYVLHYLLRLEPFSHLALALQGGIFDKADRLFSDIKSSWDSASKKNLQDVRELIPEFYYLAEFLVNSNHFDYGVTQLGSTVDNVELPPWAKGDPREFVRVNRKALESDYVSENLHHWIDLIFGYKQRGEEAVKTANVFVHLTYEGEVDVDSIDDPTLRESAIAQINNFGQTPSRLFNQPHPQRDIPLVIYDRNCDVGALTWHEQSTPPMCIVGAPSHIGLVPVTKANAIGYYGLRELPISDAIYLPDNNRIIAVGKGSVLYRPEVSDDIYVRFNSRIAPEGICFYSAAHSFGKGTISDRLISCQSGLHRGAISAVVCTQGGLLVTGGEDAAVRIWDWLVLNSYGKQQMESSTKSLRLRGVLSGHSSTISCLAACETCSLVVSGGEDGNVLMWDLWNCSFIRHLPGHSTSIKGLSINESNGNTVTFAGTVIRVWTINGDLLARYTFNDSNVSSPTCVCFTNCPDWQDGAAILVGHENGDVTVWGIQWSRSTPIGPMKIAVRRCSKDGLLIEDGKTTDEWIMSTIDSDVKGGLLASHLSPPHEMTLRRVLHSAHSTPITCVRTVGNQGILIGDSKGVVSRWMSIRLNEIPVDEALELIAA